MTGPNLFQPYLFQLFQGDADIPAEVDVGIIGGGIIGVSAALELAARGVRVALCEKGAIGSEQSSRNWGWVRRLKRDPAELPLAIEARFLWQGMQARTGVDVGYRESGILYVASDAKEMAGHEAWHAATRGFGLETQLLGPAQLAQKMPGLARQKFVGGVFMPGDGRAEPYFAAPAIAAAARAAGAKILVRQAVRGVETTNKAVSAIVTERAKIRCGAVLLAAGAWTRLFAGNLGIDFKQLHVRSTVARIEHAGPAPDCTVGGRDFAVRPRLDGGFSIAVRNNNIVPLTLDNFLLFRDFWPSFRRDWRELQLRFGAGFFRDLAVKRHWRSDEISPFERVRINSAEPYGNVPAAALRNLIRAVPDFAGARLTRAWSGIIDVTPNELPVISATRLSGLFIASGFSGHGFGIGPAAGRLAADLLTGRASADSVAPFVAGF